MHELERLEREMSRRLCRASGRRDMLVYRHHESYWRRLAKAAIEFYAVRLYS